MPLPKPPWLRKRLYANEQSEQVNRLLREGNLHTVCDSARCPNKAECFGCGTATFLILGEACTRSCRFCAVAKGKPRPPNPEEPETLARAAAKLNLRHVVVTSVTRDDLADGGLEHFGRTVACLRKACPESSVEILTPDFRGVAQAAELLAQIHPDVFNHNIETVPRLYAQVRPEADWGRSVGLLEQTAARGLLVKSGLMLGLGETAAEVEEALRALAGAGVAILVMGQYLQPAVENVNVVEYIPPERFAEYERKAYEMGFRFVAAGPFARSSYKAHEALITAHVKKDCVGHSPSENGAGTARETGISG